MSLFFLSLFSFKDVDTEAFRNELFHKSTLVLPRGSDLSRSYKTLNLFMISCSHMAFPGGSDGKGSACNVGDLGLIPGSRRYPGEGSGYSSILTAR